ncbi:MAG: tetratricopeptide repeat protein, partial [Thermoguttaceae bacterium]
MRTLNVKRIVVLLVVVIVVAGSAHLLHSYQVQRSASTLKNQAQVAWNENPRRNLDAVQLMRAYLVLQPHDYEAREDFGIWLAESRQFPAASVTLEELLRSLEKQNPPDAATIQKVRRELIWSVYMAPGQARCSDAVTHLKALRDELPDDVDVLYLLGTCQFRLGQLDDADKSFSAAIKLRPDRVDVYVFEVKTLLAQQKQREAEQCMANMIAYWETPDRDKDKAAYAHQVYGVWFKDLGKHEDALKQAKAALDLKKDYPDALFLAARMEMALGHFPKAEQYARRGKEVAPQDPNMYSLLADICMSRNDQPDKTIRDQWDKAIDVLKEGLEICLSKDDKVELLWPLANLYLDRGSSVDAKNIAGAQDCIKRLRDYHFSPGQKLAALDPRAALAFLDAHVAYVNGDWKSAREGFEKVRPQLNGSPLLRNLDCWIGDCYLQQGNPDQAMAAFRSSLNSDKLYFRAHDGLAQVFLANGQFKEAADEYRQATGNPADVEALLALARSLMLWNSHRSPSEENWDEVDRALHRAEELAPHNGQIPLLRAQMLLAQGHAKEAGDLLKALRENSPTGFQFWIAEADMAARQGKVNQARKLLDEAKAKLGDQVPIRLYQAAILLREQGLQAGAEIVKLAADADAFSPTEKAQLWQGLMNYLEEIKEYDRAKELCRQIAGLQPHDATVRYHLFELALRTHDARDPAASLAELDRVLEEIDKIAGQGPLWLYCKAVRLMFEASRGDPKLLDAAMDYATQAQKTRQTWSRPHVLQGEICRQQGRDEEALKHYLQAAFTGDRDPEFIRLLLEMLFKRQRSKEAEQVIALLDSAQTPLTPEIGKEETEIFALFGDFNRALESANNSYDPASDDYRDHAWHGKVLKILARRAKLEGHQDKLPEIKRQAEQALRRACQIAPNAPDCRVELVRLLVATDQMKKAKIAADDAEQMIPPDASPLAMGYINEAIGETQKAGQCYEKAFKLTPDLPLVIGLLADFYVRSNDPKRAAPLIGRLLSGELQTSESDLTAARRLKAILLFNEGYPKFKEAFELIDRNLASPLASPQDKRLKVRFLLADPRWAHGPEVLALAASLVATGGAEPDPDDRFQLAGLYLARGDWEHCRDQMGKLVNGDQGNPRYLAAYVRMLLDKDELSDAERWLDRLDRDSHAAKSVALRADLMFRGKHWGEVPRFLADYVSREKGDPKEPLDRTLIAARLLEDFGGRLTAPTQKELARGYFDKAREW